MAHSEDAGDTPVMEAQPPDAFTPAVAKTDAKQPSSVQFDAHADPGPAFPAVAGIHSNGAAVGHQAVAGSRMGAPPQSRLAASTAFVSACRSVLPAGTGAADTRASAAAAQAAREAQRSGLMEAEAHDANAQTKAANRAIGRQAPPSGNKVDEGP